MSGSRSSGVAVRPPPRAHGVDHVRRSSGGCPGCQEGRTACPLECASGCSLWTRFTLAPLAPVRRRSRASQSGRYGVHKSRFRLLSMESQPFYRDGMGGIRSPPGTGSLRVLEIGHCAGRIGSEPLGVGPCHASARPSAVARWPLGGAWTLELCPRHNPRRSQFARCGALAIPGYQLRARSNRSMVPHRSSGSDRTNLGNSALGAAADVGKCGGVGCPHPRRRS